MIRAACVAHDLPVPGLVIEPGRAIVARGGVTVYRVAAVKRLARHTVVAVDSGMGGNPRPALYGTHHPARLIGRPCGAQTEPMTVVGRHCEAGDVT